MDSSHDTTLAARRLLSQALGTATPVPQVHPTEPLPFGDASRLATPGSTIPPTRSLDHLRPAVTPAPALPTEPPASPDASGLRGFVNRVRSLDYRAEPELPRSFLKQLPPPGTTAFAPPGLDVAAVRRDFPLLSQRVNGEPLIWLDNAATTQKPQAVIDALVRFYSFDNSNIHRGAHTLAARATEAYEHARQSVADFLGAGSAQDILFVRGCTEGINLVAHSLASSFQPGDEILLTELEHHANIVPWQMVARQTGAILRVAPLDEHGAVPLDAYQRLLGARTRVVALSHASNSLGTILPVEWMTAQAKAVGARVLIDGAQSVAHFPVDVRQIGCDFYVFSGHKIFAPTGIGAVYMTPEAQQSLPPWQGGGNMIRDVTFDHTTYADPPAKFEAGTPSIADAVGLAAALDYVNRLGRDRIATYEHQLLEHASRRLAAIPGLRLIGTAPHKVGVLSFVMPGHDLLAIGRALDARGIAVRAGHHCAQPSLRRYGLEATIRPSLAFYNTAEEIDRLAEVLERLPRR
jgi:cysteine desulfurase/selenocysteine lyase